MKWKILVHWFMSFGAKNVRPYNKQINKKSIFKFETMETNYSELQAQLASMAADHVCNGYQLFKFEREAGRPSDVELTEAIRTEWEALDAEAKKPFCDRE